MIVSFQSPHIRYTGRWGMSDKNAVSATPGAYFEFAFQGKTAVMHFDLEGNAQVRPHLFIRIDGLSRVEVSLDAFVRVSAPENGNHIVQVIFKSAVEPQNRWNIPLASKVSLMGIEMDGPGILPEDHRPVIEFVGDSITEGISIDTHLSAYEDFISNCVYWDDATATYAWLAAEKLNFRPVIMGYGCVGVTRGGSGGVPAAPDAYPFCYEGASIRHVADYVVINHGANDSASSAGAYTQAYRRLLSVIRKRNPEAKIFILPAFLGVYFAELKVMAQDCRKNDPNIFFIDSSGWLPAEPVHPHRDGHEIAAQRLADCLRDLL